jgi:hypothetical protein
MDGIMPIMLQQGFELLGGKLLMLLRAIAWPARSPDFSAPDYFLWEHLKSKCT